MNLNTFEKKQYEKVVGAEALGESEVSFAHSEMDRIKQKIEKRKQKQKRLKMVLGALGLVILILTILVGYSQYRLYTLSKEEVNVSNGVQVNAKTGEEVIKALSRHILIPQGTPQIAEVQDVSKLRDSQAFFKDAQNGDIIIVYGTTIILYRPSKDIVVAMGDMSGVGQQKP